MENSIINKYEISYRGWLSKGTLYAWEAACILVQANPELCVKRHSVHGYIYLKNPIAQQLFEVIKTWPYPVERMQAKPCWYIDKMIKEFEVVHELLLNAAKDYYLHLLQKDRDIFLIDYQYLARKLDLDFGKKINESHKDSLSDFDKISSPSEIPLHKNDSEQPWVKNAKASYMELRLGNEHLSKEQMAEKVRKDMQKKHSAGEADMTKRGGKKVPSAATILRHVLIYL